MVCQDALALRGEMKANHLAHEKSPYLLQHAHNPVDWYPWGDEAFERARRENKPLLVSIGYSTCHWCHVMESESFENPTIAAAMNKDFICIKVDREERPDIDRIYMSAVQAMTGQGGWPLNVFLTPELKPFFGGTYFPPEARWGQQSFPALLARVAELWRTKRREIDGDAEKLTQTLKSYVDAPREAKALQAAWLDRAFAAYEGAFDPEHAGFGGAPKFPMPVNQNFLLRYYARTGSKPALRLAVETLRAMARGGIYDQLGGGFHRYSTDAQWHVPHFEKMLYDNAQLAVNYLEAYQATGDEEFARVARETLDYVLRDLTAPEGGFYSAEDADSLPENANHKSEGAFYVWAENQIRQALGQEAGLFIAHYGVLPQGNAANDPHGEFSGKNILYAAQTSTESAARFKMATVDAEKALSSARARLLELRSRRPRPSRDDKILTSWNGLMISSLAKGSQVLGEKRYLSAAVKAANFLRSELYDRDSGKLWRRWRQGQKAVAAVSDDYVFLAQGLIDLYEASFDPQWLEWALELTQTQQKFFAGPTGGLYMTRENQDSSLIMRVMEDSDNVEPAASSVGAINLLRLGQYTNSRPLRQAAEKSIGFFAQRMSQRPLSMAQMLCAADFVLAKPRQILIAGGADDALTLAMLRQVNRRFLPVKTLMRVDDGNREKLSKLLPFVEGIAQVKNKPTAYVCVDYACELPTDDLEKFKDILDARPTARR